MFRRPTSLMVLAILCSPALQAESRFEIRRQIPSDSILQAAADGSAAAYVGISDDFRPVDIAVDLAGNAYVGGTTNSRNFPVTPGAFQTECFCSYRSSDTFVAKLNPNGSELIFSTYLAAANILYAPEEMIIGLKVDAAGDVFIAGTTGSPEFPVTSGAFKTTYATYQGDAVAFVTKLNASGTSLLYSTFLTGDKEETIVGIRVDDSGNAFVAGSTDAENFPVSEGGFPIATDYLIKLNPEGSAALYATRLPSSSANRGITLGPMGDIYLLGASGVVTRTVAEDLELPAFLGVVNAARESSIGSRVAPGELIIIYGNGIGPEEATGLEFDSEGRVATELAGTQVVFGGTPSPMTYAGPNQLNAVVPLGLSPGDPVTMEILHEGDVVAAIRLFVTAAEPGVFRNLAFAGPSASILPAAALNQDGTVNSPDNPAALGSIVAIFTTGLGRMEPGISDGEVLFDFPLPKPRLLVSVNGGDYPAVYAPLDVQFIGQAPILVAGVVQINFWLPAFAVSEFVYARLDVNGIGSGTFTISVDP